MFASNLLRWRRFFCKPVTYQLMDCGFIRNMKSGVEICCGILPEQERDVTWWMGYNWEQDLFAFSNRDGSVVCALLFLRSFYPLYVKEHWLESFENIWNVSEFWNNYYCIMYKENAPERVKQRVIFRGKYNSKVVQFETMLQ